MAAYLASEAESGLKPSTIGRRCKNRDQNYILLLIKEAMIGRPDGIAPPDKLADITRREVAAGRTSADDEFHKLAVAGDMVLTPPQRETRTGSIGAWIASWFK